MSTQDFQKMVASEPVVMIDFNAPWCAPCVKMLPTVHQLEKDYAGKAKVMAINYDENKALAKELGIDEIPAFLMYKNGKLVERKNGLIEEKNSGLGWTPSYNTYILSKKAYGEVVPSRTLFFCGIHHGLDYASHSGFSVPSI